MQIVILLALAATMSMASLSPLVTPSWALAVAAAVYPVGAAVLARASAKTTMRLESGQPLAGLHRLRNLLPALSQAWLVLGSVAMVELGYATWIAQQLGSVGIGRLPLAREAMLLAPLVVALVLVWMQEYPSYLYARRQLALRNAAPAPEAAAIASPAGEPSVAPQSVNRSPWTRRQYITYNMRHQLLFILVPAGVLLFIGDLMALYIPKLLGEGQVAGIVWLSGMLLCTGFVFLIAPLLIVNVWRTIPMPDGPIRRQLEEITSRMNLRFRRMLVWQTGGMITNAGVMGMIAPVRYVLMSDALLEQMEPRQVQAVFAHEAGHVVSHHILYSGIFAAGIILFATAIDTMLSDWTHWPDIAIISVNLILLVTVAGLGFGYISRRFERQSDVIAAWAMGQIMTEPAQAIAADCSPRITPEGAAVFARALQRVAEVSGVSYNRRNWRHGSIAWRVQYIMLLGATGGTREGIDRQVRRIKAFCLALLAATLTVVIWQTAAGH